MHYSLDEFETIPLSARQQLAALGIHDTDQLLSRAATPRLRDRLAQEAKISARELTLWAGLADLVRIKGIGPAYAESLVASELVGNVQQLLSALGVDFGRFGDPQAAERIANQEDVRRAASELAAQLKLFAQERSVTRSTPSVRQLTEAAEEAAELRPRLVLAEPPSDQTFRQQLLARAREARRFTRRTAPVFIGIVLGALALILVIMFVWAKVYLDGLLKDNDILTVLFAELWRPAFNLQILSMAALAVMVSAMLFLLYAILSTASHVLDTWFLLLLFDSPAHRGFYQKVESLGLARQKRGAWQAIGVVILIAIALVIYTSFFTLTEPETPMETFANRLALPIIFGGVLAVLVVSAPVARFYIQELRVNQAVDEAGFRRYLIYLLSKLALLPLMIVILTQIALPCLLTTHRQVYRAYILPEFEAEITARRSAIISLEIEDESAGQRRDRLLATFDETVFDVLPAYGCISEQDTQVFDLFIPSALHIAVWWSLAGVVLLFVLPYFAFGGWLRGLFYMIVLFASFQIENQLQESAPTWFSLDAGSPSVPLVIAFAVFANALFFDWLFDTLTERQKVCPACQAQLDVAVIHCSFCGLVQPGGAE